jgi:heparan sulfate N-deacetylase/N-sulfotransferase NDST2
LYSLHLRSHFNITYSSSRYKVEVSGKSLPILTHGDKGRFGVIAFENYTKYLYMDKWNKELLDKYCREYNVGIVGFMPSRDETYVGAHLKNSSLFIDTNVKLKVIPIPSLPPSNL